MVSCNVFIEASKLKTKNLVNDYVRCYHRTFFLACNVLSVWYTTSHAQSKMRLHTIGNLRWKTSLCTLLKHSFTASNLVRSSKCWWAENRSQYPLCIDTAAWINKAVNITTALSVQAVWSQQVYARQYYCVMKNNLKKLFMFFCTQLNKPQLVSLTKLAC